VAGTSCSYDDELDRDVGQGWMGNLMQLVESHNQQGTGQGADWSNLSQMVGHYNAAQSSGGGVQDFQNKYAQHSQAMS